MSMMKTIQQNQKDMLPEKANLQPHAALLGGMVLIGTKPARTVMACVREGAEW